MDPSISENNFERLAQTQPQIAYRLPYHDNSDVLKSRTRQGEPNLRKRLGEKFYSLHSPSGALEEAKKAFGALDLDEIEVLYVLGLGLGYMYLAAQRWLKADSKRQLVFLEDDLSVLAHFLDTETASSLLDNTQVTLRYSADLLHDKELFDWLYWDFLLKPVAVVALPSYRRHRSEFIVELEHKIPFDHHRVNEAIEEYFDHGISYFRNFYRNLRELPQSYLGDGLFGQFKDVPAIICGAGPSLEKALSKLGDLADHALIFAGGSSTNALTAHAIQPHFTAGVDPNSQQFQRYVTQSAYEVPFFYRQRINHDAFRVVHGPKLYLTGAGGYDVPNWFEAALDIEGSDLDEGHNIINFCTSIAHALGCNPIIFVGLDLAYTGMKTYAPGIVPNTSVKAQTILSNKGIDKAAVVKQDIYGEPIYTLWKWIAESEWLSNFAAEHPETTFINATEGGLGAQDVPNIPFSDVIEKHLVKEQDLQGKVWEKMQQSQLPANAKERLDAAWKTLESSLQRCVEKFDTILDELRNLWRDVEESLEGPIELKTGLMALSELELEDEPGYIYVLAIFNEVFVRALNRELRLLKVSKEPWKQKQHQQLTLETRRCVFLRETARTNLSLMQEARNG